MKINITKKQYRDLIEMCAIANSILGIMGDELDPEKYKEKSDKSEELQNYLLQFAKEMDAEDIVDKFEGRYVLDDDFYEEQINSVTEDYDDHIMFSSLANRLARRDFHKDHTKEEIKKMAKENGGYFGVELHDYEKKYWDEFEEHGTDQLFITN